MQVGLPGIEAERAIRDELDRCYTPQTLADACLERAVRHFHMAEPRRTIEPSIGGGAFARSVLRRFPRTALVGIDIDPDARGLLLCKPAVRDLALSSSEGGNPSILPVPDCKGRAIVGDWPEVAPTIKRADLVIGNPPFSEAIAHVETARRWQPGALLALVLPLAYLGVKKWAQVFERHPLAALHPIAGRPWPKRMRETALYVWPGGGARVIGPPKLVQPAIEW